MINRALILVLIVFSAMLVSAQSPIKDLPQPVQETIRTSFSKYKVFRVEEIKPKTGGTLYKIEARKKKSVYRLTFNQSGVLLSKTKLKSYSFDGSEEPGEKEGAQGNPVPPI